MTVLTIEIERRAGYAVPVPTNDDRPETEERRLPQRPLRCTVDGVGIYCYPWALPFVSGSLDAVRCIDQLEFIRDEVRFIDEVARVLRPGGELSLRVPATGALAGFDAFNLFRYFHDVTHRGVRPSETREIGWRRHYSIEDLRGLLRDQRFDIIPLRRSRWIITEMASLKSQLLFRWIRPSSQRYEKATGFVARLGKLEDHVSLGPGFLLKVSAIRNRRLDEIVASQPTSCRAESADGVEISLRPNGEPLSCI